MENEKLQINLGHGVTKAEVIIREVAKVNELDVKPPVKVKINGTIGAPYEFLQRRLSDTSQVEVLRCHVLVNREEISIELITNEHDEYLRGIVTGRLENNPKFKEFGINTGKVWTPTELGMFCKMNRAFFADRQENLNLVNQLMNFTATVNNNIQRSVKETGDRTDNFAQVVDSNLPKTFALNIPIFKGLPAEKIEVETFAQINGRDVAFVLLSPGAKQSEEEIRDQVIDQQLEKIREIAPQIAIIEV